MKSKHKRLPPHSWEAHPKASKKDAHKELTIVVVTIGAIVVLALLLFLGQKQFAGKAFFSPAQVNSIGISQPAPIAEGEGFFLTVETNIGDKDTVGIMFELDFPDGLECTKVESMLGWESNAEFSANDEIISTSLCDNFNKEVVFKRATTNYLRSRGGTFPIAKIYFKGVPRGNYSLKFDVVNALNLADNTPIILTISDPTIEVIAPTAEPECGNGVLDADETCDDSNIIGGDGCSAACDVESGWSCPEVNKCLLLCKDGDNFFNIKCLCESPLIKDTTSGLCLAASPVVEPECNNQILDVGESCDAGLFRNSCESYGFRSGTPTCDGCQASYRTCVKDQEGEACNTISSLAGIDSTCAAELKCEENEEGTKVCVKVIQPQDTPVDNTTQDTTLDKPIDIKLTSTGSSGVAINSVDQSKGYDITVTLTPTTDLPAGYLMLVAVNYGTKQTTTKLTDQSNPALAKDSSKTFTIQHTADGSAANLTVSAMVWNGYLTDGFDWKELVPAKEKTYAIK